MQGDTTAWWIIGLLVAAVAALIQWWMRRIEADIRVAKTEGARSLAATETALRGDIDGIGARLREHELRVATEYVSFERLRDMLRPVQDTLAGIKAGQDEIFRRLDGKQDKAGHD